MRADAPWAVISAVDGGFTPDFGAVRADPSRFDRHAFQTESLIQSGQFTATTNSEIPSSGE
jgi:hypothetical protein